MKALLLVLLLVACSAPAATPRPTPVVRATPRVPVVGTNPTLSVEDESIPAPPDTATTGTATWYCGTRCTRGYGPSDLVAAIDPTTGYGRGARLLVSHGGRSVTVRVVDVCACPGERVIDLTSGAFRQLAPLSVGVIDVTLEEVGPVVTPPATDR